MSTFCVLPDAEVAPETTLIAKLRVLVKVLLTKRAYMCPTPLPPPDAKLTPKVLFVKVQPDIVRVPLPGAPTPLPRVAVKPASAFWTASIPQDALPEKVTPVIEAASI